MQCLKQNHNIEDHLKKNMLRSVFTGFVLGLFLGKNWVCFRSGILNFRSIFLIGSSVTYKSMTKQILSNHSCYLCRVGGNPQKKSISRDWSLNTDTNCENLFNPQTGCLGYRPKKRPTLEHLLFLFFTVPGWDFFLACRYFF